MRFVLALLMALFVSNVTNAASFTQEGYVEFIRAHHTSHYGSNNDWVSLEGVSSIGSCRVSNNRVVLKLSEDMDRVYSTDFIGSISFKKSIN